jgi:predicted RNA binding protein YcfA (HicA-like mRNA interferase family)
VTFTALDRTSSENDTAFTLDASEREGALLVTVQQLIDVLEQNGWRLLKTENNVRQYKHEAELRTVTVSGKLDLWVPQGMLRTLLRSAQSGEAGDALCRDL